MNTYLLVETRTLDYKSQLYFRAEFFRIDTGAIVQVGEYFADVYLLMPAVPLGAHGESPLRRSWRYLEDFPKELSTALNTYVPKVMLNILSYADANALKLGASHFKHW